MPDDEAAISCRALAVRYHEVPALDGIDLTVHPGECVAVLGASGSGKTTLLHAIAGLVSPSAGEIWLAGRRVASARGGEPPERRDVGLVFQDFALWPHLSAVDTVAYPLRRAGRPRAEARAVALRLLGELGIGQLAARRPAELSGGQRQRVGLARALARSPAVFLLDEPTAHLDTHLRAAFEATVRDRRQATGAVALYATHDAGEALALADRVAVLVGGRLVQVAAPTTVYTEPAGVEAARLTGACTVLTARAGGAGDGRLVLDLGTGPLTVAGGGDLGPEPVAAQIVLRPDWVRVGGPLAGRVVAVAFRGAHTDYRLDTAGGPVQLRLSGPPQLGMGQAISWGIERAWALPIAPAPARADAVLSPAP